jgi:salicylate hydroxylase
MLPFLAQGAAMAVEDAWVLAREISQTGRPASKSLMAYQASRLGRTAKTQAGSRANMRTFHRRTKLGKFATYGPMWLSGKLAPSAVHRRMDWLYGHDVTQG